MGKMIGVQLATYERRRRIMQYYLQGKSQVEIAMIEDITQAYVSRELKAIRQEMVSSCRERMELKVEYELKKIDHLEAVAWEKFAESCHDAETKHVRTVKKLQRDPPQKAVDHTQPHPLKIKPAKMQPVEVTEELTTKGQVGDPRWLDQVRWCVETRCKILGIIKPDVTKTKNTTNNFIVDWDKLYAAYDVDAAKESVEAAIKQLPPGVVPVMTTVQVEAEGAASGN